MVFLCWQLTFPTVTGPRSEQHTLEFLNFNPSDQHNHWGYSDADTFNSKQDIPAMTGPDFGQNHASVVSVCCVKVVVFLCWQLTFPTVAGPRSEQHTLEFLNFNPSDQNNHWVYSQADTFNLKLNDPATTACDFGSIDPSVVLVCCVKVVVFLCLQLTFPTVAGPRSEQHTREFHNFNPSDQHNHWGYSDADGFNLKQNALTTTGSDFERNDSLVVLVCCVKVVVFLCWQLTFPTVPGPRSEQSTPEFLNFNPSNQHNHRGYSDTDTFHLKQDIPATTDSDFGSNHASVVSVCCVKVVMFLFLTNNFLVFNSYSFSFSSCSC
jgi:hypothetical protein